MLLSAILCTIAVAPRVDIDFEVRATSLTNALGKLSRMTGVTLRPDRPMANGVVCVKANHVALEDLMARIAEATGCEWKEVDGARVLYRSPEATKKFEDQEYKARVAYLKKLLDPKQKELASIGTPYERAKAFVQAVQDLKDKISQRPKSLSLDGPRLAAPSSTLVTQLVVSLGPELLAQVPDGDNWVFSDQPTHAERALGANTQQFIRDYEEAEAQLGNLLPDKPEDLPMIRGLLDDIYASAKRTDGVGKVLFTVGRQGRGMHFEVTAYTEEGKARSWGFLNTYQLGDDAYERRERAGTNEKPAWVDLSPLSADFAEAEYPTPDVFGMDEGKEQPWTAIPPGAKKALQNPEEIDPLSMAVTDGCFALGDQASVPIVAYLSDGAESAGRMASKDGRLNLARFSALIKNSGHYIDVKDGWLVIKPWYPLYPERYRLSRAALGKWTRAVIADGAIELEPYCRFHFEAERRASESLARLYGRTLTRYGIAPLPSAESHAHEPFAMLGSLSPDQWRRLRRGEQLRIGQMPPAQRERAEEWMKKDPMYLKVDPRAGLADIYENWTEYAPYGLPKDALIGLEERSKYVYRRMTTIIYPDGSKREGSLNGDRGDEPATVAKAYATGGYYKSFQQAVDDMRKGKSQVSQRSDFIVRLRLLPTHEIEETFYGPLANTKTLAYDEWPESMRQEFEDTFKQEFKGG